MIAFEICKEKQNNYLAPGVPWMLSFSYEVPLQKSLKSEVRGKVSLNYTMFISWPFSLCKAAKLFGKAPESRKINHAAAVLNT